MPKRRTRKRTASPLPVVLAPFAGLSGPALPSPSLFAPPVAVAPGLFGNPFAAQAFALAELSFASWETVVWRSWAILQGTCTPAEYSRMAAEKAAAAWGTGLALMRAGPAATLEDALAPWRRRASANARRLRRKATR